MRHIFRIWRKPFSLKTSNSPIRLSIPFLSHRGSSSRITESLYMYLLGLQVVTPMRLILWRISVVLFLAFCTFVSTGCPKRYLSFCLGGCCCFLSSLNLLLFWGIGKIVTEGKRNECSSYVSSRYCSGLVQHRETFQHLMPLRGLIWLCLS